MLKYLICGAAALGVFATVNAASAAGVIVNGTHYNGGTHTIPYGHTTSATYVTPGYSGTAVNGTNCCAGVDLQDTGVIVSQPTTIYQPAPAVTTTYAAPATTDSELVYIAPAPAAPAPIVQPVPAMHKKHHGHHGHQGWGSKVYVAARVGWTQGRDSDFGFGGTNVKNEYSDKGYNVSGAIGWRNKIHNHIGYRVEAELGYQTAEIDAHDVGGTNFSGSNAFGDTNVLFGFANLYFDVPVASRLNLIAGGGLGVGHVELDGHGVGPAGVVMDDSDTTFGYHLDAGLSYDVTPQLALEAMYRYTSFVDAELRAVDGRTSEVDIDSHNVTVGARYGF